MLNKLFKLVLFLVVAAIGGFLWLVYDYEPKPGDPMYAKSEKVEATLPSGVEGTEVKPQESGNTKKTVKTPKVSPKSEPTPPPVEDSAPVAETPKSEPTPDPVTEEPVTQASVTTETPTATAAPVVETPKSAPAPKPSTEGSWVVNIASLQDKDAAIKLRDEFRGVGLISYVIKYTKKEDGSVWYRVRIGFFMSTDDAAAANEGFKREYGRKGWVAKANDKEKAFALK